jgi:hypothetical protein
MMKSVKTGSHTQLLIFQLDERDYRVWKVEIERDVKCEGGDKRQALKNVACENKLPKSVACPVHAAINPNANLNSLGPSNLNLSLPFSLCFVFSDFLFKKCFIFYRSKGAPHSGQLRLSMVPCTQYHHQLCRKGKA